MLEIYRYCTSLMTEDEEWNAASSWITDQVLLTFRHRAILSRLAPSALPSHSTPEMLRIELPPHLNHPSDNAQFDVDSVAHLRERLKYLSEIESFEADVTRRRKSSWLCRLLLRRKRSDVTMSASSNSVATRSFTPTRSKPPHLPSTKAISLPNTSHYFDLPLH